MTKPISLLFAASMLFTFACDVGEEPVAEDRAAELDEDSSNDKHDGHHGKRGDRAKFAAEKLCAQVECSEAQAAQVSELFASRHEARGQDRDPAAREAHKAARAEANKAIASAFAADSFDPSVLERAKPERDDTGRADQMIAFATELHGILTPEQRSKLADKLETRGGMFFGGHGGKHGKRGKHGKHGKQDKRHDDSSERADKPDPSERLAHKVDGFCEKVTCTDDQKTQLTATFERAHEARRDQREDAADDKPDFKPVADAFRADTLDAAALRQAMSEMKTDHMARKGDRVQQLGAVVSEVHQILTPAQRAIVAAEIEAHGVHALTGKRGGKHHGKRGGKHGKRDAKRGHDDSAAG
ncbi:Spy/CpxP family protein refolding chaperone [Enhygromyxa salina]|uniref:Periplasmic protein n=1 Tax=Enhygromyxa salina TaxID=215803 RepID=A0A2S9XL69_9BACT|nr:Spy/CpxP family protein refolding chaperone [Enhygromyxa salina]PRP93626.1 periplasmic protein [Enhygromyxa salina]